MSTPAVTHAESFFKAHSQWLVEIPARILAIVVVTLIVRAVIHRMIDRAVRPVRSGDVPRILRPFKERVENSAFLESTGLLSERRTQRAATIGSVLKSAVSVVLIVVAVMLILSELKFDLGPFIAGTSIIGVALGFGAQSLVKDFLSGIFMMLEDQYGVGDIIDFEQAVGTVEAVGLRTTRLRDINGTVWYVRNGEVIRVGNKSQGYAQVVLDVPIHASADISTASEAMLSVAREMHDDAEWSPAFLSEPEVQGVEQLTRYETQIRLAARVRSPEQWRVARELRQRIRLRFDEVGITQPDAPTIDPGTLPATDAES